MITHNVPKRRYQRRIESFFGRGRMHQYRKTLFTLLVLTIINFNNSFVMRLAYATKNFCGIDWADASSNCEAKQPCATGIDDECTSGGTCWADTNCDTTLGHGTLYNRDDPSHARFCGTTYNDAMETCSIDTHCPTGDHAECPEGQACFSFLTGCNYVDMVGGPGNITISGGNATAVKLDPDDPTRNNYCGTDWNDAISNCENDDHWCSSGSDSDCPEGKTCFAGTDCKYDADLFPTVSPTSGIPTVAPSMYNDPANLRFCGIGWEDAGKNCRIDSHCPSGEDADCPEGQACFDSPSIGCNIVDFKKHLAENGTEIFGSDHGLLTEDSFPGQVLTPTASAPPSPTISTLPSPTTSDVLSATVDSSSAPVILTTESLVSSVAPTPSPFQTSNHVFCGTSWQDASDRCSPETFCSEGAAMHQCPNPSEFCWVGITACDASEWSTGGTVSLSGQEMTTGSSAPSSFLTSPQTVEISFAVSSNLSTSLLQDDEESPVIPCNEDQPCPSGYACSSNILCVKDVTSEPVPTPIPVETDAPSSSIPLSNIPTSIAPSTNISSPPIAVILSEDEIAQRLTNENNYCGTSLSEVMMSCSYTLQTCNEGDSMCGAGTFCFENILCTDSQTSADASSMPAITTPSPTLALTSVESDVANIDTTIPQKKCASSLDELLLTCDTAPTCSDSVCPGGMFCFSELICAGFSPEESNTIAPASLPPTKDPTWMPSINTSSLSTSGSSSSNGGNQSISQNYCASSKEELQSTCATAQTCNDNDAPCPSGFFCFPEVICELAQQTEATFAFNFTLPTKMPTPLFDINVNDQTSDPCNNLCLQPLDSTDCDYALSFPNIMPCTGFPSMVQVGDLCTGTGICGTTLELNTCSNAVDFYWRLEPYRCIENGLVNGSGVILPSQSEQIPGDATSLNPAMNFSQSNFSPPPSSSVSGSENQYQNKTNDALTNFSGIVEVSNDLPKDSGGSNATEFTGWWLKENSSPRTFIHTGTNLHLCFGFGLFIVTLIF